MKKCQGANQRLFQMKDFIEEHLWLATWHFFWYWMGEGGSGLKILLYYGFKHLNEIVAPKKSLSDQMTWRPMLHWNIKNQYEWLRWRGRRAREEGQKCWFADSPLNQSAHKLGWRWRWQRRLQNVDFDQTIFEMWLYSNSGRQGFFPPKKVKKKHNLLRWLDSTHPLHIKAIFLFKYNLICFKIYILRVTDGFIACSQSIFLSLV